MKVLGHRGCIYEPENTIRSFERAFELGADGVELDTQSTSDGMIVVSHDRNLKRLVGFDFDIKEHTLKQLSEVKVKGESIPTLESILEIAKSKNKIVDVELKNPEDLTSVAKVVDSFNYDGFFISSFYHRAMFEGKSLYPHLRFAYLYIHSPRNISDYVKEIDFLKPYIEYFDESYKDFASITIPWTVNEKSEFTLAKDLVVFGVITDVPDVILNFEKGVANRESIFVQYLKGMVVSEETSLKEGILTFVNNISDIHIEGIWINGNLIDVGKPYPFLWKASEKLVLKVDGVSVNQKLAFKTRESGLISVEVEKILR